MAEYYDEDSKYKERRIDRLYNTYLKRANNLNIKHKKEGATTFKIMNKTEFRQKYIQLDVENKRVVSAGGIRDKNIVRTIVNNQAYIYSPEVARTLKKQYGLKNVKMSELRTGAVIVNIDGNDVLLSNIDIKERNKQLYNYARSINDYTPWGITETGSKGASLFMTQVLYGSP